MKLNKIWIFLMVLGWTNVSSASIWGKIKNAFNDCRYDEQEYRDTVRWEKEYTSRLPEYFSGSFSEQDFKDKSWLSDFRYVIVINKASRGRTAQSMRVYDSGRLIRQVKVSTGREGFELRRKNSVCTGAPPKSYWSQTPTGFYTPKFLSRYHVSSSWDADMPFAIFYDVENGLALHQVNPSQKGSLGKRASGGCTRQDENTAEDVFNRVAATAGATIPMINVDGSPVLDGSGNILYIDRQLVTNTKSGKVSRYTTYSALIIVENVEF